ncbi:MAG: hypothetical protein J6W19_05840 [Prevotella sp.]|nr:hypothetical protein [Prevotella sp.]
MKKRFLQLALGLLATTAMQAQTSPWASNELPEEGGTFYLYNVESGQWLQNNNKVKEDWTTRAQVDKYGLDVEIVKLSDGLYRLNPKFGRNHSINGHNYYMDTDDAVTSWVFEPDATVPGSYKIHSTDDHYLAVNDEGFLDDFGWFDHWQLVTLEQRMEDLRTATKANPKDATWLIGGHDFANMDERNRWDVIQEGDGVYAQGGDGIVHGNRAVECWKKTKFSLTKTITGLPNGTYEFKLQGFYRDGSEVNIGAKRDAGEEVIRASFFLNDVSRPFMSILDCGVTEEDFDSYAISQGGVYIPGNSDQKGNALDRASNCFFMGGYWNEPVRVVVSDGTLTIGMQKIGGGDDDWLVFDSFTLTYLGNEIDIDQVRANLQAALAEAANYQGVAVAALVNAIAEGQAALNGTDATAIAAASMNIRDALAAAQDYTNVINEAEAFEGIQTASFTQALADAQAAAQSTDIEALNEAVRNLRNALNEVRGIQDPYKFLVATIPFAQQAGVDAELIAKAQAAVQNLASANEINDALNQLRVARKIKAADKHADVFAGAEPAEADFYIYNVGLQRFLCGGGDWGAHAYVGFPGIEISLTLGSESPAEGDPYNGYMLDTHLNNGFADDGTPKQYLNYGGYMDTDARNLWEFVPVEGKTGVYAIARANGEKGPDGQRMLLGYRPGTYGNIDTDMYGIDNPNNQWKLVTKAERLALMEKATSTAPQDATFLIQSPGFNQREDVSAWASQYERTTGNVGIWGRNDKHPDFAYECWNEVDFDLGQFVYGLLPGWYEVSVQGYYRDGDHQDQIRAEAVGDERVRAAMLVDMNSDTVVELPNILDEADKAPGLGNRSTTRFLIQEIGADGEPVYNDDGTPRMIEDPNGQALYAGEFPMWVNEACDYFQNGLYKTTMLVEVKGTDMNITVQKFRDKPKDWVVLDNFRLTYYGAQKPAEGIQGDVNGDGAVDVADISAVISVMAGTAQYPLADVNGDGAVDVADISNIISIMAEQ